MKKILTFLFSVGLSIVTLSSLVYAGEDFTDKTETIELTTDNWDQIVEYVDGLDVKSLEGSITLTYADTDNAESGEMETVELTIDNWNQFFEIKEDFHLEPNEFGIMEKYGSAGKVQLVLKDGIIGVDEKELDEISFLADVIYDYYLYEISDYNDNNKELTVGNCVYTEDSGAFLNTDVSFKVNDYILCEFFENDGFNPYTFMGGCKSLDNLNIERVKNKDSIYYGVPQITIKNVNGSITYDKNSVIEIPPIIYTDSETIKIVQEALNQAGFDCGTPDGSAGPATLEALNAYQEANGLPVTTDITSELLDKMGIEK